MADAEQGAGCHGGGPNVEDDDVLKPFHQRAAEAEERLSKLESLLAKRQGKPEICNQELSSIVKDFQSKLEITQKDLLTEREKASKEIQKLAAENAKLQYRVSHLIRALREAESKPTLDQGT